MKGYLVGVIGFVVAAVSFGSTVWPFRLSSTPPAVSEPARSRPPLPDMHLQALSLIAQTKSTIAWRAVAQQATWSAADQRVVVDQPEITIFPDSADAWHITATRGLIDQATGDMAIEGQVRLQQRGGYTIDTNVLHWHPAKRVLMTDAPVAMRNASISVSGIGLRSQVDQHRITLQHAVRASFRLWND